MEDATALRGQGYSETTALIPAVQDDRIEPLQPPPDPDWEDNFDDMWVPPEPVPPPPELLPPRSYRSAGSSNLRRSNTSYISYLGEVETRTSSTTWNYKKTNYAAKGFAV